MSAPPATPASRRTARRGDEPGGTEVPGTSVPPVRSGSEAAQHAAAAVVAPLALEVVLAGSDHLVVLAGCRRAERSAERPRALVAVLSPGRVVPRRPERVGVRLVVLVARDV